MKKVLVIGEYCLDWFIYGKSNRKSPEGKGPVFIPHTRVFNDGMAGNTVRNLKAMGLCVDKFYDNGEITKSRYVDSETNELYIRVDENDVVDRIRVEELHSLDTYDAVIISDYCKGFLAGEDINNIAQRSKLVILDTKKKLGDWCKDVKFIKLNRNETENNKEFISNNEWVKEKIISTLDSGGASWMGKIFEVEKIEDGDVSGAGDTFVAGFVSKYLESGSVEESIRWGNHCAGEVVRKKGVSVYEII